MTGWRAYLPTHDERGRYRGPLSSYREWHAVAVGFVTTLVDRRLLAPVVSAAVRGETDDLSSHVADAAEELAYTAIGAVLAEVYKRA
jgi:hypothetical protein